MPSPTHRVARDLLDGAAVEGWDILAAAELQHRHHN
jgi:hypothetical protein